ncbi:MAG: hypothetical protein M3Q71_05680 [Chloroflexota bacterium]|nr:hypothetical protein [Chloroflexota bacterium]
MAIRRLAGETKPVCVYGLLDGDGTPVTTGTPVVFDLLTGADTVVVGPLTAAPGGTLGNDWCAPLTAPITHDTYTLRATVTVGAFVDIEETPFIVGPVALVGTSRAELRRRIALELGDFDQLEATRAGSTTTFFDEIRARKPTAAFRAREALFVSGTPANIGLIRRVQDSNADTQSLTLQPALPAATAVGDVIELYNERGIHWPVNDIHRIINSGIRLAYPDHLEPIAANVTPVPVGSSDRHAVHTLIPPPTMIRLHSVVMDDPSGGYRIPRAVRLGAPGYWIDKANGTVTLSGVFWPYGATPATIRLEGYAEPAELLTDEDRTTVDEEWLVTWCMARLLLSTAHRNADPDRERRGYFLSQEAQQLRRRVRTLFAPNTEPLR